MYEHMFSRRKRARRPVKRYSTSSTEHKGVRSHVTTTICGIFAVINVEAATPNTVENLHELQTCMCESVIILICNIIKSNVSTFIHVAAALFVTMHISPAVLTQKRPFAC